ncbi:MAG TPA: hypothetical protein PLJ27_17015, partial [Polyangiaceae bacterium]|nr:hypothetical protein [Polyangiaceae bacterium]
HGHGPRRTEQEGLLAREHHRPALKQPYSLMFYKVVPNGLEDQVEVEVQRIPCSYPFPMQEKMRGSARSGINASRDGFDFE